MTNSPVRTLALLSSLLLFLPAAAAQSPEGPLLQKVDEKRSQAFGDPVGSTQRQASEEQLAEDGRWAVAYACYAVHAGAEETGVPDPDLEPCEGYEEAIGVEDEEAKEEAVADAEELTEGLLAEAEAMVDDVLASVGRILEDPGSAPSELVRLMDRLAEFVSGLLRAITGAVGNVGRELDALTRELAVGLDATLDAATQSIHEATRTVDSTAEHVQDLGGATVHAVMDGLEAIVEALTGGREDRPADDRPSVELPDEASKGPGPLDGLICTECLEEIKV